MMNPRAMTNRYNFMLRSILRYIGQLQLFFPEDEEKNKYFEKDLKFYKSLLNYEKENIEIRIVNDKMSLNFFS